jgi:PAS domain-containing protein
MVSALPQLAWTCRPDGLCIHLSPQWVEYTGVAETRQLGLRWLDQIHPEDRTTVMASWNSAVASGEPFRTFYRLRRHDGGYHAFDTRALALRDDEGRIVKWFGLSTIIPDQPSQSRVRSGGKQHGKERGARHGESKG